ncbi:MAG: zinc-binding alcohol dehydrogenase family protein [Halorhabdus sp.]
MRAIEVTAHGGPSVLTVTDRERPDPGENEVRIEVERSGVNFADIEKRRGKYPDSPSPPYIPGIEVAGRIDATGANVDREIGEPVAAILDGGGYAEYAVTSVDALIDIPDGLDITDAAALPVQFVTAHNALFEWGDLDPGERVLVHAAAGGVGTAAVQLAHHAGATVFGTASTDEKLSLASDLGVTHSIKYTDEDVAERIDDITDGEGVDLVLDGVGGDAFYAGLDALADCGRIVTYGMASGDIATVSMPRLFFENKSVIGYHLGHARRHATDRVRAGRHRLRERIKENDIEPVLGAEFSLVNTETAHERLESRETAGKVLLAP